MRRPTPSSRVHDSADLVGSGTAGDPPAAWLMPLVGDAVIGLSAPGIAYLIVRGHGLGAWTAIAAWNIVGIWDGLSAFLVHRSVPWPEFFVVEIFGTSMFSAASAMHLLNLWLVTGPDVRAYYVDDQGAPDRRPIPS